VFYGDLGTMKTIGVAIIGGGIVGLAILREIAAIDSSSLFLFEKGKRLGEGQTGRSLGVLHSGILAPTGSLKALLCAASNKLTYEFCARNGIAVIKTGKLFIATREVEIGELRTLMDNAGRNSALGIELLTAAQVRAREPNLTALAALSVPSAGIVDISALVGTLARHAKAAGANILTNFEVLRVDPGSAGFEIVGRHHGKEERVVAKHVINSAGLSAFSLAKALHPEMKGKTQPVRAEYYKFNRSRRKELQLSGTLVYSFPQFIRTQIGQKQLVCIASPHLTATFQITNDSQMDIGPAVIVGPIFYPADDPEDLSPPRLPPDLFARVCREYLPGIREEDLEPDFAGVMTTFISEPGSVIRDFVIKRDEQYPNAIHLLGIGSPGLTSSLAIGRRVSKLLFD
jgi:2-hydroxyglutarate dehydrogenase